MGLPGTLHGNLGSAENSLLTTAFEKKFECAMDNITPSYSQCKTIKLQFLLKYTHLHIVSTLTFSIPIAAYVYFTKL